MENSQFVSPENDENEFGIGSPYPYVAIKLTNEQFKQIEYRKMDIYHTDGRTFFEEKDKDGKLTGNTVFFLIFK